MIFANFLMQITKYLFTGRMQNVQELLANAQFQRSLTNADREPLIVTGDMNCPSHLDWTEKAK
jgi:endonuclease/exonuclease/phosphatase family metal-dependent hydrolase